MTEIDLPKLHLLALPCGKVCVDGDNNMPARALQAGTIDIDNFTPLIQQWGLKKGDVVIDVGAFIGDTALAFAQAGCTVYAFEPFLDAYVCAIFNTAGYPVFLYNQPAGNGEKVRLVYDCPGPNLGMRSVREDPNGIPSFRLDDLLPLPRVDFMKIDCEGSEIPTLLGAQQIIAKFRPRLFVEMFEGGQQWRGFTPKQLSDTITGLGYKMEMVGTEPRWDWYCVPE